MTPEQFHELKEDIRDTIQKKVNGKLDAMEQKLDDHNKRHEAVIEEIKPIIEAYHGTRVVGEALKWISSVALATLGLWAIFKGTIKL